jgi:hypothetical protein
VAVHFGQLRRNRFVAHRLGQVAVAFQREHHRDTHQVGRLLERLTSTYEVGSNLDESEEAG